MPTTCRYRAGMGEWLLHYEVINRGSWYPKSRAALGGLRRPVQYATFFIRDLDNNQFQPNILHDFANDTVAPYTFPVFFFRKHMSHENEAILRKSIADERK